MGDFVNASVPYFSFSIVVQFLLTKIRFGRHPSATVLIPALRTVGNIVTGDDAQTQVEGTMYYYYECTFAILSFILCGLGITVYLGA